LTLRPAEAPWRGDRPPDPEAAARAAEREAAERQNAALVEALLRAPESEKPFRELIGHLLDFHKREAKPGWWFQFTRCEMAEDALIEDSECLGGLERDPASSPFPEKRSTVYTYTFPAQDFKMKKGGKPRRATPEREPAGEIFALDEKAGRIQLKVGPRTPPLPDRFALIPEEPLSTKPMREAVIRYAASVLDGDTRYPAVSAALKRELPRLEGVARGTAVVSGGPQIMAQAIHAISRLDSSCLLIQGPPGSGKTYLSARAIVALLKARRRVAIAANSHKAINRLLREVAEVAARERVVLRGVKK